MDFEKRLRAFVALGRQLAALPEETRQNWHHQALSHNGWFTPENVDLALTGIVRYLREEELREWLPSYLLSETVSRKVGVVMAGNIPAAGFHDMLCVLLSGHTLYAKLSSQDPFLLRELARLLIEIAPAFTEKIVFAERLNEVDAIIATGSDNSARYFAYYFGRRPHIIRRNRTSCAVLTGEETAEELHALGKDMLQYFGLGCRNVSKLFVPRDYTFEKMFERIQYLHTIMHHHKYANNYDYNKSIYLVNGTPHFDNGFLLLTESEALVSPLSVVHYETYPDAMVLKGLITQNTPKIQCIVSKDGWYPASIPFGEAQQPRVWDYADGVDTMQFLLNLP